MTQLDSEVINLHRTPAYREIFRREWECEENVGGLRSHGGDGFSTFIPGEAGMFRHGLTGGITDWGDDVMIQ